MAQGAFHEAVNLAAVWQLPVVFWCENNGYAEFSPAATQYAATLERRASGYGVDYVGRGRQRRHRHGQRDAHAWWKRSVTGEVRPSSRPSPTAGTATTRGTPSDTGSRPKSMPGRTGTLSSRTPDTSSPPGFTGEQIASLESSVARELDEAVEAGPAAWPDPDTADLGHFVTRPPPGASRAAPPAEDAPTFRMMDAVHSALEAELAGDDRVFVAGIDVAEGGNVFGLMRGLHDKFGDRVRDTPISETAIMGLGVGAAMAGMRPVVELMYLDFVGVCLDQLLNQAAKMPFMTGGTAEMALTVRTQFGAGRSSGSQHSQSLEALLAHIPGLSVVMPSTPADTYGLLRAAIQDPNPVVFIENRLLYGMKGPQPPRGLHPSHRQVGRGARRHRRDGGVGITHGPRGPGRGRGRRRRRASRSR